MHNRMLIRLTRLTSHVMLNKRERERKICFGFLFNSITNKIIVWNGYKVRSARIYTLCNGTSKLCATRCWRSKPYVIITHFPCQIAQHKIKRTHQLVIYKTRFQLVKRSPTARGTKAMAKNGENAFLLLFLPFVFYLANGSDRRKGRERENKD